MESSKIGKRDVTFIREMRVPAWEMERATVENQGTKTPIANGIYSPKRMLSYSQCRCEYLA